MMIHGSYLEGGELSFHLKGALNSIIGFCDTYWTSQGPAKLDTEAIDRIEKVNHAMSSEGLRVLGCASGSKNTDLTFLGLIGIQDVPRTGMNECISRLLSMGIHVVMITGDSGIFLRRRNHISPNLP
jgi:P-type E1-E2 ATPase